MYYGKVDVRKSELDGFIQAAECLCIKGLGMPEENLGTSDSPKKVETLEINSSYTFSDNLFSLINRKRSVSSSPSRKKQKKGFGNEEKIGSDNMLNYSPVKEKQCPSNLDDGREGAEQTIKEQDHEGIKLDNSNIEQDNNERNLVPFIDVDKVKQEPNLDENQMDSYIDSIEAGPSGLQEVGLFFILYFWV